MAYYIPTVWKSGGTRPRVPHLIAPMGIHRKSTGWNEFRFCSWSYETKPLAAQTIAFFVY